MIQKIVKLIITDLGYDNKSVKKKIASDIYYKNFDVFILNKLEIGHTSTINMFFAMQTDIKKKFGEK